MKVAALAALGVLIAFHAEAAPQQRQLVSPATTCDNDGHCKTASADATSAVHKIRPKAQKSIAAAVQPLPQPRPSQVDSQSQQTSQAEQPQDPQQAQQAEPFRIRMAQRGREPEPQQVAAGATTAAAVGTTTCA